MPKYIYQASTSSGRIIKGEILASDKKEIINYLSTKKLTPILIKLKGKEKVALKEMPIPFFGKISTLDKANFASRLSALLKAGVSVSRALDILIEGSEKPQMKKIYLNLKAGLERGQPLWQVLNEYKKDFTPVFIGLIKAGEESGNLEKILDQLAINLRKDYLLTKKIQAASFYPSLLLGAAILIISFLIIFIIPKLVLSYAQADIELPGITIALIQISNFIKGNYLWILIGMIFLVLALQFFKKTKKGELFFAKLSLRLPLVGDLSKKMIVTRFSRTLSMLLMSGLTIGQAIEVTSGAVGNSAYKNIILDIKVMVIKGVTLSNCLRDYPKHFPPLVTGTIAVGEEAGKLDEMLSTMSNFYEEEVDRKTESLMTIIEPILLLIMGVVVAFIALSVIVPIYQFTTAF